MSANKIYISLKHRETLIKELHTQFKEGRNCDLEIRLNKKRLYVHKCLIDIFFIKCGAELEDDRFYLDLTRYSQLVVEALIGMVYTGNLCCKLDQVENVYKAAIELGFAEAQNGCQIYLKANGMHAVTTPVSDASVDPFPEPLVDPTDQDPTVVIKTEPCDHTVDVVAESFDQPRKADKAYRSTIAIPVSSQNIGIGQPTYNHTLDSSVTTKNSQQMTLFNSSTKLRQALLAPVTEKPSQNKPTGNIEYVYPKRMNNDLQRKIKNDLQRKIKLKIAKKKACPVKVSLVGKGTVDRIRQLASQKDSSATSTVTKSDGKMKKNAPEKHNFSATSHTEESEVDTHSEKSDLIEYKTKSGTVYYKHADPNSVSNDEFSIDTDGDELGKDRTKSKSKSSKGCSGNNSKDSNSQNEDRASTESDEQAVFGKWMESNSAIVKMENVAGDTRNEIDTAEDEIEVQKKEQMFSLGLTKKVEKDTEEKPPEKTGKRRLRARKKVDYSKVSGDQDESSDYDPYEFVVPKKKFKSHSATVGRHLKIDSAHLVTIAPQRSVNMGTDKPNIGTTTVAVKQAVQNIDYDSDTGQETAYFPPAGSVPAGVRSRYAQGKYMKVRYVTESIRDLDGNITVLSKPVPVRPRQFGMDERLMNRPAVYVCHPTAPVVKPVVRKKR